jgi:hypothetical protein
MPGLVHREAGLFLDYEQPGAGMRLQDFKRGGETENAAANDREIVRCHALSLEV